MIRWARWAAGLVIIGSIPLQRTMAVHQGFGLRAALVVAVVVFACAALDWRPGFVRGPWGPPVVALGAALTGAAAGGKIVGAIFLVTTLLAAWTAFGHRLRWLPPFDHRSLLPIAGLVFLAGRVSSHLAWLGVSLMLVAVAWGLAFYLAERPEVPKRATKWLGHWIRVVLTAVLLFPLWVLTALVPWALQRLVGFDPLRHASASARGWIARRQEDEDPGRLWFRDPALGRAPLGRRVQAVLPFLVGCALVAAAVVVIRHEPASTPPETAAAVAPSGANPDLDLPPWVDEMVKENDDAISKIWFSQYAGNEWSDYQGTYFNITDGQRQTWRSQRCRDEQVLVWVFGGSTAFGVNHRDDFTLPSTLAKLAERRGINLHVVNWGMPGDVAWQENRRFERAMASGAKPDVVVFYDGWNDLRAVADMDFSGRGGPTDFAGPMDRIQMKMLSELGGVEPGTERTIEVPEPGDGFPWSQAVELAGRSYAASQRTSELLAEGNGVELFRFYQPSLHTREPRVAGDPESDRNVRAAVRTFREGRPDSVIDISDSLDAFEGPVYVDEVHVQEQGNALVAQAMLDEMQPTLEELSTCR